jgi:hypothetical protein
VADDHDDPGHATWGWKDALLGQRQWYYAKVLRKRATMIAFDVAPYFYALTENYGAPDEDYLTLYEQGRMPLEKDTRMLSFCEMFRLSSSTPSIQRETGIPGRFQRLPANRIRRPDDVLRRQSRAGPGIEDGARATRRRRT